MKSKNKKALKAVSADATSIASKAKEKKTANLTAPNQSRIKEEFDWIDADEK